ncbi:vegetative protein [Pyxidicoccus parkwayensis]|uniref:vegetative protein n=1 Tax=Pyxidicoccus parkwayensis TaxID=2813578 RepID=UPI001F50AE95|nr:vegetative protein [Pyxidicoccus parkwaysis]
MQTAVQRMDEGLEALEMLRSATYRLAPLTSRLGAMAGVRTPSTGARAPSAGARAPSVIPEPAAKRGRGPAKRGRKPLTDGAAGRAVMKAPAPVQRARVEEGTKPCAVIGCKRPSRSKGYCSAHYQKLRLLMRTNRRPTDWVDDARPQSVREVKLPRGRAASKALQESAPPSPPAAPPKPKAWVRKKGKGEKVSLH